MQNTTKKNLLWWKINIPSWTFLAFANDVIIRTPHFLKAWTKINKFLSQKIWKNFQCLGPKNITIISELCSLKTQRLLIDHKAFAYERMAFSCFKDVWLSWLPKILVIAGYGEKLKNYVIITHTPALIL